MLELTDRATEAIRLIVTSANVSDTAGLRISANPIDEQSASLDLALVESPDPSDALIEEGEARVFVEQNASLLLDDKVLDATVDGDQVAFSVGDQPGTEEFSQDGRPS